MGLAAKPRALRRCLLGCCLIKLAFAPVSAAPEDNALIAAMRLSENRNYSWTATVADDARTYDINGQTGPDDFSRVRMPAINSLRRRLARGVTDTDVEFIFRGNVDCVVATERGWLRPEELPPAQMEEKTGTSLSRRASAEIDVTTDRAGAPGGGSPGLSVPLPGKSEPRARDYSNLQRGLSRPHEELGIIVSCHRELKVEGNVVTGSLTERGAQLLLVRDGHPEISPQQASGLFTLWLNEGMVARYHVQLSGQLEIATAGARRTLIVNQTTDTVLKAIGTTRVEIPEEARLKLAQ